MSLVAGKLNLDKNGRHINWDPMEHVFILKDVNKSNVCLTMFQRYQNLTSMDWKQYSQGVGKQSFINLLSTTRIPYESGNFYNYNRYPIIGTLLDPSIAAIETALKEAHEEGKQLPLKGTNLKLLLIVLDV